MKNYSNKGITLVSLVVTIIVLIILAGVSINLMLGEKGIITIAKQAKENTELAKVEEETKLNELYMQIEAEGISSGDTSYDAITKLIEFKREIASAISDMGVITSEDEDASTMATNIRSISSVSSADKVSYDNANSGLTSTNVQGAVDEINNSLDKLTTSPSTTNKIFDYEANDTKGMYYYTPTETKNYCINFGGSDTYSSLIVVDTTLNVPIFSYGLDGIALKIYGTEQITLYKDVKYRFECWNSKFILFEY